MHLDVTYGMSAGDFIHPNGTNITPTIKIMKHIGKLSPSPAKI